LSVQSAEVLASGADRRCIDDRQQLLEILDKQRKEQSLVGVLQVTQEGIALEIGRQTAQHLQPARHLFVKCSYIGRQEAVQIENVALGLGERCTFIEQGVGQQLVAGKCGFEAC